MRTKLDNEDEFKMLEKVVKRYKFNLVDEDLEEMHRLQTTTKKLYLEEPSQMSGEDDDDSETQNLNGAASPDGQVFMVEDDDWNAMKADSSHQQNHEEEGNRKKIKILQNVKLNK
jgi:hypothetical protein